MAQKSVIFICSLKLAFHYYSAIAVSKKRTNQRKTIAEFRLSSNYHLGCKFDHHDDQVWVGNLSRILCFRRVPMEKITVKLKTEQTYSGCSWTYDLLRLDFAQFSIRPRLPRFLRGRTLKECEEEKTAFFDPSAVLN